VLSRLESSGQTGRTITRKKKGKLACSLEKAGGTQERVAHGSKGNFKKSYGGSLKRDRSEKRISSTKSREREVAWTNRKKQVPAPF